MNTDNLFISVERYYVFIMYYVDKTELIPGTAMDYRNGKQLWYQIAAVVFSGHGSITRELLTVIMLTKITLRILKICKCEICAAAK